MPAAISWIFFCEPGFWQKFSNSIWRYSRESFKLARRFFSISSKVFCFERKYFSCKNKFLSSADQSRFLKKFSRVLKARRFLENLSSSFFNLRKSERNFLNPPRTKIFLAISVARWGEKILFWRSALTSRFFSYSFFSPKNWRRMMS